MTPGRLHRTILRGAALLVPVSERAEWLAEWKAELWYVKHNTTIFCLGSFRDAFWLARNRATPTYRSLESPLRCVLSLASVAALGFMAFVVPSRFSWSQAVLESIAVDCFWIYFISILMLASATPLRLGEYPANRYAPGVVIRVRRWVFLTVKIALLAPLILWWSCTVGLFLPALAPAVTFLGLAFGFRWALADQRQRCPVCLHLITSPTRIGNPSRTLLTWSGTELICANGHGLLYIPDARTSWYGAQSWQYLDPTWSSLFS